MTTLEEILSDAPIDVTPYWVVQESGGLRIIGQRGPVSRRQMEDDVRTLESTGAPRWVALAQQIASRIPQTIVLPPVWCVWTSYNDGWSKGEPIWSAHDTQEEANRWLPFWQARLAHRKDYDWHVSLRSDAPPTYYRLPDLPDDYIRAATA